VTELSAAGHRLEAAWHGPGPDATPTLVLLHEGLGSVAMWRDWPAALAAATGPGVFVYSRRGYGASEPRPAPWPLTYMHEEAALLPAVLDAARIERAVLVGHSDGGSIALIHASRHPVTGLVLLAPHVVVEERTVAAIRSTRRSYEDGGLRERMARHHDDPDAAFWGWCDVWLDPAFRDWTLEAEAGDVTAPTLLIQGADDPYGTLDQIDRIAPRVRGPVRRLVLPGGHAPHAEHEDAVVRAVAAFAAALP